MYHHKRHISYTLKRRIVIGISVLILALLYAFRNTSFLIRALSTVVLIVFFYLTDHLFDIKFKWRHYLFIIVIAVASLLLSPLYYLYPGYDKVLHFVQPILFSSILFYMISQLNIKLKWKLAFTFFIVVAFVGMFEIAEYLLDIFFGFKLQGDSIHTGLAAFFIKIQESGTHVFIDRIDDTMIDMLLGVAGAFLYSAFIYIFYRNKLRP